MFIIKLIGKIFVLPVILFLAVLLGAVKIIVGIYSTARALVGMLLGILVVAVVFCYHDWIQVAFLLAIAGISVAVLLAGVFIEVVIENMISSLGSFVMS